MVANARRLKDAAGLLGVPVLLTEQNPDALGATVRELAGGETIAKMEFDVTRREGFLAHVPDGAEVILAGCEAHICVLQTALGLMAAGHPVRIVRDAVGSRRTENREAALARLAAHGADIVTTEMVVFEWIGTPPIPASARWCGSSSSAGQRSSSAARVAPSPMSSVPCMPRFSISRTRARLTRLLMVPTATPQISAASS